MSFPASGICTVVLDSSSRSSSRRDPADKCLLRFSDEFFNPSDEITKWYSIQPYTSFQTIQYRRENTGIRHEFILIRLQGKDDGYIKSHCRLERTGDPDHRFKSIEIDGTIAEDYIHAVPLENHESAELIGDSDVVVEITFPNQFDLRDALAICYGISKHRKAKRYTLQQYNCYFFSWTIVMILARACVNWDMGGPCITKHIQNIREDIKKFIDEQGHARSCALPYILSYNASGSHENGQEHPLDQVVMSEVQSAAFVCSITEALLGTLWVDKFRAKLVISLTEILRRVAKDSFPLLDSEEVQSEPIGEADTPDAQLAHRRNVDSATRKIAERAVVTGFDSFRTSIYRIFEKSSRELILLKQRMGIKLWHKCLRRGVHSFFSTPDSRPDCQTIDPQLYQPANPSICDHFLVLPSSTILSFFARVVSTGILSATMSALRAEMKYKASREENGKRLYQKTRKAGSVIVHTILGIQQSWAVSKWAPYLLITQDPLSQAYIREFSYAMELLEASDENEQILCTCWNQALDIFSKGIQALALNEEPHSRFLRQSLMAIFKNLGSQPAHPESLMIALTDLGNHPTPSLDSLWLCFVLCQFSDRMVEVAHYNLEGLITQTGTEALFWCATKSGRSGVSQTEGSDGTGHEQPTGTIDGTAAFHPDVDNTATSSLANPDRLSYERLQTIIRDRISRLSRREPEFAPILKQVTHAKSPERCRLEIEVTMEEIWISCRPLVANTPQDRAQPSVAV